MMMTGVDRSANVTSVQTLVTLIHSYKNDVHLNKGYNKVVPVYATKAWRSISKAPHILNLGTSCGGWFDSRPGRFTSGSH